MGGGYVGRGQSPGRQRLFTQVNVNRGGRAGSDAGCLVDSGRNPSVLPTAYTQSLR